MTAIYQLSDLAPVEVRAADPRLVAELHARRGPELWGLALRLGLSEDAAGDAVQETFVRLWTELRRGTRIESPDGWVFRTLYRLAMDHHRLRRRARALLHRVDRPPRSRDLDATNDRLLVWTEVDRLPVRQRAVLYLRHRADLRYDQIGTILGMSPSGARSHATQALATLRRRLDSTGGR